jgi:hypothetical protein
MTEPEYQHGEIFNTPESILRLEELVGYGDWDKKIEALLEGAPNGGEVAFILSQISDEVISSIFPFKEAEAKELIERLKQQSFESVQAFTEELKKELHQLLITNYTPQSLVSARFEKRQEGNAYENHKLNELLYYHIDEKDVLHLHVNSKASQNNFKLYTEMRDGFKQLAKDLQTNPKLATVTRIEGTSWIVADRPLVLERLGFIVDGPISEELRKDHFSDDSRGIWTAHISTDEFIQKYQN